MKKDKKPKYKQLDDNTEGKQKKKQNFKPKEEKTDVE